jgi:putative Mg2+ transporter-C (MgtC) family protein
MAYTGGMILNYLNFNSWLIQPEIDPLWSLLRLSIAAVLGGLIGFERGRHHQVAGLRTHILICVGSCLIMELGMIIAGPDAHSGDPARLAAQVVSGIGFLGAGAIIRFGMDVHGLTTAASVWTVSGIGLAAGAGLYVLAVSCTLLMFLVLRVLAPLSHRIAPRVVLHVLTMRGKDIHRRMDELDELLGRFRLTLENMSLEYDRNTATSTVRCQIWIPATGFRIPDFIDDLQVIPQLDHVALEVLT